MNSTHRNFGKWLWFIGLCLFGAGLSVLSNPASTLGAGKDSCIACHSDKKLLVKNRKLYTYFQNWQKSPHQEAEVTCSDCHGGNPDKRGKEEAHGGAKMSAADMDSPINYLNIPNTCAVCHEQIFEKFKNSKHFKNLSEKEDKQGPNCVTCHGSVNTYVLNVNNIKNTCNQCHNEESGNNPDIPDRAEVALSNFLTIYRYYGYLVLKGTPRQTERVKEETGGLVKALNVNWHTFDLDAVEKDAEGLLAILSKQAAELRKKVEKKRKH